MISFEVLVLAFVAFINLAILWVIASQGWRTVSNRYFIGSVFFVLLWVLGTAIFFAAPTRQVADFGITLFYIAPMYTITFLSLFAAAFSGKQKRVFDFFNIALIVITLVNTFALILPPALLTETINLYPSGHNELVVNQLWYSFYFSFFNIAFLITFVRLFIGIKKNTGVRKQQFKYIFIGTFLTAILSLVTNLSLPLLGETSLIWLGPTWSLFYVFTIGFSIIRHGLFDIKQAAVRTAAYVVALAVLAVIYYLLAYVVSVTLFRGDTSTSVSISPVNIALALVLAFLFQPIKNFFDKITDDIFYRDRYNSDEFYARLSEVLTSTTDLRNLLQRAAHEIGTTLKSEQTFFFVQYNHSHHVSAGTSHHISLPVEDAHELNKYVTKNGGNTLITNLLPATDKIHRLLTSHRIEVLMPLMRGSRVIGYLGLGDQRTTGYTNRDMRVLQTVSDELVIAIQNALSVQEVKDINTHLEQRIDSATKELQKSNTQLRHLDTTKDEFLSMASHQLRTPLTSVKGYLSMVLEGDAGKITDMQKHLLSEAFTSSERMVHLIHDFLNVSRLQTGKFMLEQHPYDLGKLVKEEVDSLRRNADTRHMKLKFVNKVGELILNIDENKIRQVVMNFVDNALYYSHEDTTIVISLEQNGDTIEFRVVDTGIGVPKSEQAQLFSKFYRASNARKQRPDGTGVGIFLAKKVVTSHGGDVLFESIEGKGSTFGFTLPTKKLLIESDDKTD